MTQIEWLEPYQRENDCQYFRQWITEAWRQSGGRVKKDLWLPWKLKMLLAKLGFCFALPEGLRHKRRLIVCVGGRADYWDWPWCYRYEIVPIVWDCWPRYHQPMVDAIRRQKIKTVFCTARQTAERLVRDIPGVKTCWLPEGIKVACYPMGPKLMERSNDVMKFGRDVNGRLRYPTFESFTQGLRAAKIVICRPRCDTHPDQAGNIETLTQRYWECMLSGAVIVGRAPKELVDFCGYNPVVELDVSDSAQVQDVLAHIDDYQPLVDRNRRFAEDHAGWDQRILFLRQFLEREDNV